MGKGNCMYVKQQTKAEKPENGKEDQGWIVGDPDGQGKSRLISIEHGINMLFRGMK